MPSDDGLRPLFHENIIQFHWVTVETGLTGRGIPDSEYCHAGESGWVEYKATPHWYVPLDAHQVGWLLRRHRAGGRVTVAVRRCPQPKMPPSQIPGVRSPRHRLVDELWLVCGSAALELKRDGLRGCPPAAVLGCWSGGPAKWDWAEVATHLTR